MILVKILMGLSNQNDQETLPELSKHLHILSFPIKLNTQRYYILWSDPKHQYLDLTAFGKIF